MQRPIDYFVHLRCINFFIHCVYQGLISRNDFDKFVHSSVENVNLIGIILRSMIYTYDSRKEGFDFLKDN